MQDKSLPIWLSSAGLFALLVLCFATLTSCDRSKGDGLMMDMNGHVLGGDDPKSARPLYVGVGETAEQFVARNPYLKGLVFIPPLEDASSEMRLSLLAYSQVHYDDGDLKLEVCASSSSVDGDKPFKRGVAVVGMTLCEQPLSDYARALQIAGEVIHKFKQNNPGAEDMRAAYTTGSPESLERIGGRLWTDGEWHSKRKLFTIEEVGKSFSESVAQPSLSPDTWRQLRPKEESFLIGIYAGKRSIFQIRVESSTLFGDNNLTTEQRLAMRYSVYVSFRLRADVVPGR